MFGLPNTRLTIKYIGYHELTSKCFSPALIILMFITNINGVSSSQNENATHRFGTK